MGVSGSPGPPCLAAAVVAGPEQFGLDAGLFFYNPSSCITRSTTPAVSDAGASTCVRMSRHSSTDFTTPIPKRRAAIGSCFSLSRHTSTCPRLRIDHDVEAVLRPVVDHEVEPQSRGNPAARPLNDVHARQRESLRFQPALRLHLRGCSGARRPFRQEEDFPLASRCNGGEARDGSRLGLAQRFPEVLNRLDMPPEPPLLARGHPEFDGRRHGVEVGRRLEVRGRIFHVIVICQRNRCARLGLSSRDLPLQSAGHPLSEQKLGLASQLTIHVREDAVEVECNAQGHGLGRLRGNSRIVMIAGHSIEGTGLVQRYRSQQARTLERAGSARSIVDEVEGGVHPSPPAAEMTVEGQTAREALSPGFRGVAGSRAVVSVRVTSRTPAHFD